MSQFFDRFEEIRDAVRQRLTATSAAELPADGTAGPRPFDIEPLEKWLYEAYARSYKDDVDRLSAFWGGVAEALEEVVPPTSEAQGQCVKRCADLMDQIANNFGIQSVKKEPFARANEQLAMRLANPTTLGEIDILTFQSSLLRIALLSSANPTSAAVLQTESNLWTSIHRLLVTHGPSAYQMLVADTLCVLFRAWAVLGRRNPDPQRIVRQSCQTGTVDKIRLEKYMKRTHSLLNLSMAVYEDAIWQSLQACVSGKPVISGVSRSGVPRYSRRVESNLASMFGVP